MREICVGALQRLFRLLPLGDVGENARASDESIAVEEGRLGAAQPASAPALVDAAELERAPSSGIERARPAKTAARLSGWIRLVNGRFVTS